MCETTGSELLCPDDERIGFAMKRAVAGIRNWIAVTTVAMVFAVAAADAAELVLFHAEGCPFCEAWEREVGGIYHLTEEARRLPLRRVDVTAPRPPDLVRIVEIRYTPTFVVTHAGGEIGRIVGYHSQDQFWGLLGEIIAALPSPAN